MNQPPDISMAAPVPCEYVQVPLGDGYPARGRYYASHRPGRAAVYLHGIQSHSGWFVRSCDFLRQAGLTVLAPDRRGSGMNQQDRGHCENAGQLLDDLDRAVDWLQQRTGAAQVDVVAVSWSGKLALVYAQQFAPKVRSVILTAPGLCPKIDIRLPEKISVGWNGLVHPHKLHTIPLTEPSLFTANPAMLEFLAHDPLLLKEATASFFMASKKLDFLARQAVGKVKLPVHLFLAGHDRIVDNEATVRYLQPLLAARTCPAHTLYPAAHHTLDFEPDPQGYFADLATILLA